MRDHYLYIIGVRRNGCLCSPVKVGITSSCDARIKTVQTGSPYPLAFGWVFTLPYKSLARHLERSFHRACRKYRLNGEWFDMEPEKAIRIMCVAVHVNVTIAFNRQSIELQRSAFEDTGAAAALDALNDPPMPFEDEP